MGPIWKKNWVEEVGEKKMVAGLISSPVKINVVDYLGSQWGGPQGSLKSSPWGSLESGGQSSQPSHPHATTILLPVSSQDKIKGAGCTVSVASEELGFLKYFSTNINIYLYLLITLCSQLFCRSPLSNTGDKFSNLLYIKGTGCFLKVPYKFQTHYAMSRFTINILSISS